MSVLLVGCYNGPVTLNACCDTPKGKTNHQYYMGLMANHMSDKQAEALRLIEAAISDVHKEMGGGFRSTCLGVEIGIKLASDSIGSKVSGFRLEFESGSFSVASVDLGDEDVKTEGVWAAIYALACPRYTPFGGDPLRIKSITMAYGKNPSIEYDARYECGVPLALDRDYSPELLVKK